MMSKLSVASGLLQRALAVSDLQTKEAVVTQALKEFIALRTQKRLLELLTKLEWDDSFNYKAERSRG